MHPIARRDASGRWDRGSAARLLVVAVVSSALVASLVVWQPWILRSLLLAGGAVLLIGWIRLLARRDARALIVLWLVFAANRTASLLLSGELSAWALRLDDLTLAVALGVVLVGGLRRRDLRLPGRAVTLGMGLFAVCGAASALVGDVRLPTVAMGTWLALKLGVCLLVTRQFTWSARHVALARRVFVAVVVVVAVVAAVQVLRPEVVSAFFGGSVRTRGGSTVITSIFRTPFQYSAFMLFAVCVILSTPARAGRTTFGLVTAGFALLSLRLKAIVDVILILVTRMLTAPSLLIRAWTPVALLVLGAAALTFGSELIEARLSVLFGGDENPSPRELLYVTALAIAAAGFPLGSGFGTFGSEASRVDYSSVYVEYGLSRTYGFSPSAPIFVTDASWATVLGEAGWIGAVGFAVALGGLAVQTGRRVRAGATIGGEQPGRAALLFLVVFIADSVTSPQLFSGFSCLSLAILASMMVSAGDPTGPPDGDRAGTTAAPVGRRSAATPEKKVSVVTSGEAARGPA